MGGGYVGHAGGELRRKHAPAGSTRQRQIMHQERRDTNKRPGAAACAQMFHHAQAQSTQKLKEGRGEEMGEGEKK